jgi:phosphotriesterase-related protein
VIKVAGSAASLTERDRRIFEAAGIASRQTGCPLLTHCEGGQGGTEQVAWLERHGATASHIALSHVDKVVDRAYQSELFATGAFLEYDGAFRWGDRPNGTLQVLEWAAEDGRLDQVVLGLDAARQGYWTAYGGSPGWAFLLGGFADAMRERGLGDDAQQRLFVDNPARLYSFLEVAR